MAFDAKQTLPVVLLLGGLCCTLLGAGGLLKVYRTPLLQLSVEPTSVELSRDKSRSSKVPVKLWVTNTGRQAVSIQHVDTSCDCTMAAPVDPTPLLPGERCVLQLTADLPDHGKKQSVVSLLTDPPAEVPDVTLTMSGRTVEAPYINMMPGPIQLQADDYGEPVTHQFTVETGEEVGTSEHWLTAVKTDDEDVTIALTRVEDVREIEVYGIVVRRYHFELSCSLPEEGPRAKTFMIDLVKRSPAALTKNEHPLPVRIAVTD